MSFKAPGVRVSSSFAKNPNRSQQQQRDRLVEVLSYHIAPDPSQSYLRAREIDPDGPGNGRLLNVSIRERVGAAPPSTTTADGKPRKWSGNIIDDKMRQHVAPGTWIALERSTVERKFKEGDEEGLVVRANYINRLESTPEKTRRAIVTISARDNRVFQVQEWDRKAFNYQDDAAVSALATKMDEVAANWKAGEDARAAGGQAPVPREPGIGVRFRAIVATDEKDRAGKPIYQMIDCTPPIDWISQSTNDAGNTVAGHPVTGEQMRTFLSQYEEYLNTEFPAADGAKNADGTPNPKFRPEYADLTIEVMTFRTFWTSKMSSSLAIHERSPLWRMVNRPTLCSMEEPHPQNNPYLSEKNWAVDGILALSADKATVVGKEAVIEPRQFVQAVYANGFMASVDSLVRSSNDMVVKPHPKLNYKAPEAAPNAGGPAQSAQAAGHAPSDGGLRPAAAGAVADPFADGFGGADPLDGASGDSTYDSVFSSGTSVPPVSTPDPQPMQPSSSAGPPASTSPSSGAGHTGRRRTV